MERKSLWNNSLLLIVGGLLVAHLNVAQGHDQSEGAPTSSDASDECILQEE